MPSMMLPAPVGRSPTAVPGTSDVRDDNVYSAGVLAHGATGQLSLFTIPKGQAIPEIKGTAIAQTTQSHQTNYTDLTTNLNKAGEFGSGVGDASVRAIAINVEAAYAGGTAYGAGEREVKEIQSKVSFVFKLGQKEMLKGPAMLFGASGGAEGSVATTVTATTVALVRNGNGPRRLKIPIAIHRSDTVEGVLAVAGSGGLSFTTATGEGQPTLVWVHLFSTIRSDAR